MMTSVRLVLFVSLLAGNFSHATSMQKSKDDFSPDACTSASASEEEAMTTSELEKIDKTLMEFDSHSAKEFSVAIIEILQESRGNLNFCSIERRLRALGANTRLLALPLTDITGKSNAFSLVYPFPLFPTHSPIPRFAIWIERGGTVSAEKRLINAHLTTKENLRNLNFAGVPITASMHPEYVIAKEEDVRVPDNPIMKILGKYRDSGYLDDDFDPMLMYTISPYMKSLPQKMRFSINGRNSPGVLQFFVISQDPDRLLSGNHCNCQYLPHTDIVICDRQLLAAISNWLVYGRSDDGSPALVEVINQLSREFLFHWLVGHELGHFAHGDDYTTLFQINNDRAWHTPTSVRPLRSVHNFEASADQFAVANMPPRVANGGYMAYSYIFQQAFDEAAVQSHATRGKGDIILSDPPYEHPDFLTRVLSLKKAAGYEDFYLEKLEKQLHTSETKGVDISSVCELAEHEQTAQ